MATRLERGALVLDFWNVTVLCLHHQFVVAAGSLFSFGVVQVFLIWAIILILLGLSVHV
jgi:hypothetical protein